MSTSKEKSNKLTKNELDMDVSENITTSRRKRNRALKAIVTNDTIQTDAEKTLNIHWNADETVKIKEEILSPVDDANLSDSGSNTGSNNTGDVDTHVKSSKSNDIISVKEEKRTRAATNETANENKTKTKIKLTSSHCKYCYKKFSNASNLRRHITMSHFGPKKFTCNLCTFRARRKIDILSHVRTKHQFGGERTDALKFVTVNDDEPAPKLPQQSLNRRKEKHTEVLRDDEEEMFIDSEAFIVEGNPEHLLVLGTSNENSNTDMGDSSINIVESTESDKPNTSSKRKGRPKTKDKVKNLGRSSSPNLGDQKIGEFMPTRRPIRNRIMPVKKDFVYDLSTLLKKDYKDFHDEIQKQSLSQPGQPQSQLAQVSSDKSRNISPTQIDNKTNKRRAALPSAAESCETEPEPEQLNDVEPKEELQKLPSQPQPQPQLQAQPQPQPKPQKDETNPSDTDVVKGAADAMAQQAVLSNRAAASKPPELPAERPVATPQRQFDSNIMKDWPILKRPPAIYDGVKSKISSLKVPGLKRKKRSCLLKHSTNTNHKNRLYDKQKTGTNGHTSDNSRNKCNDSDQLIPETIKISSQLANKIQLKCAQIDSDNTKPTKLEVQSPQSAISTNPLSPEPNKQQSDGAITTTTATTATTPTTPRRMTLLERLAWNKTKKLNESLSRMSIANSDNDSDED